MAKTLKQHLRLWTRACQISSAVIFTVSGIVTFGEDWWRTAVTFALVSLLIPEPRPTEEG